MRDEMRTLGRLAIGLTAISIAAVIFVVIGLFYVFFVCCCRRQEANGAAGSVPEGEKRSTEGAEGAEMTWRRSGIWGPPRTLFAIKEEESGEEEMTESEDGRMRGGRRSSRRSSRSCGGSQDSGGVSPSTGTTPFLTPLEGSPFSTPPSTPGHIHGIP